MAEADLTTLADRFVKTGSRRAQTAILACSGRFQVVGLTGGEVGGGSARHFAAHRVARHHGPRARSKEEHERSTGHCSYACQEEGANASTSGRVR